MAYRHRRNAVLRIRAQNPSEGLSRAACSRASTGPGGLIGLYREVGGSNDTTSRSISAPRQLSVIRPAARSGSAAQA